MPAFAYRQKETRQKIHNHKQHNKEEEPLEHLLRAYPSERNRRLIEMLKARQSHYQVFYPARDSDEKGEEEVGSARDDDDDEQVSANVSQTVNDRSAKLVYSSRLAASTTKPTSSIANKLRFQRAPIESSSKAPQSNSNSNSNPNFKVSFNDNKRGVKWILNQICWFIFCRQFFSSFSRWF